MGAEGELFRRNVIPQKDGLKLGDKVLSFLRRGHPTNPQHPVSPDNNTLDLPPNKDDEKKEPIILPEGSIVFGVDLQDIKPILEIAAQPGVGKHFSPRIDTENVEQFYAYCKGYRDREGDRPTNPDYHHPIKVVIDGQPKGFTMVRSGGKHVHGREMVIEETMVEEAFQDRGVGTQMILFAAEWALLNSDVFNGHPAERVKIGVKQSKDAGEWHKTTGFFRQFGFKERHVLEDKVTVLFTLDERSYLQNRERLMNKFKIDHDSKQPQLLPANEPATNQ